MVMGKRRKLVQYSYEWKRKAYENLNLLSWKWSLIFWNFSQYHPQGTSCFTFTRRDLKPNADHASRTWHLCISTSEEKWRQLLWLFLHVNVITPILLTCFLSKLSPFLKQNFWTSHCGLLNIRRLRKRDQEFTGPR